MQTLSIPMLWFGRSAFRFDSVVRLEAEQNYTWVYFTDGRKILMSHTLAYYESSLPKYFSRIHRSHCINTHFIKSVGCKQCSEIELTDGSRLTVARRRWQSVKDGLINQ